MQSLEFCSCIVNLGMKGSLFHRQEDRKKDASRTLMEAERCQLVIGTRESPGAILVQRI